MSSLHRLTGNSVQSRSPPGRQSRSFQVSIPDELVAISTAELRRRLTDPELTIVDVRPLSAYNGWRASGEARGGHIPGAVAFPSGWLGSVDDAELERLLDSKDIVRSREVVLYGDRPKDVAAVQARLAELGYPNVRSYEHGWAEWAADQALPVDRLANYDKLVHADWLRQLLDGGRPEAAPAGKFLLFHVNFGVPEEYEENHIPGALQLETVDREPEPVASFGVQVPLRPEVIVDIGEAKQILRDREHAALVSVRSWKEQVGEVSGYNYIRPAGRIAGDVWGNCGSDAYHMQHYRNVDNTMRAYPEIAAHWDGAGISADKRVAFYCGTGRGGGRDW